MGQTDARLELFYVGMVTGQVVNEEGAPLSDLQVGMEHFHHGSFALALRRPGEPLEISAPGFATETITLGPPDQFGDVALPPTTLTRGLEVRGCIFDAASGAPVEGAVVQLPVDLSRNRYPGGAWRRGAISDSEGCFVFPHLSRRQPTLIVTHLGYLDQPLEALPGKVHRVTLPRGAIIRGTVLDTAGQGAASASVFVIADSRLHAETRDDGSLR